MPEQRVQTRRPRSMPRQIGGSTKRHVAALTVPELRDLIEFAGERIAYLMEHPPLRGFGGHNRKVIRKGNPTRDGFVFTVEMVRCCRRDCARCKGGEFGHGPYYYGYALKGRSVASFYLGRVKGRS